MTRHLRLEKRGRIATLIIDRPEKKNAFLQEMWEALPGLVAEAMADNEIRLLVLRAADGDAFSAGADIGEFGAKARDAEWGKVNQAAIRDSQYALARATKPTIALIEGVWRRRRLRPRHRLRPARGGIRGSLRHHAR